jgi:hypothetical protein
MAGWMHICLRKGREFSIQFSGLHVDERSDCCLMGCDIMQSYRKIPILTLKVEAACSTKILITTYETTQSQLRIPRPREFPLLA